MSAFVLKIIAAVSMLLDHVGYVLFPQIEHLRIIGRLAFPIYAFFIAEGFRFTKSRMKYFLRIFILGLACQIVYTAAESDLYFGILMTFSFSIVIMVCVDAVKRAIKREENFIGRIISKITERPPKNSTEIALSSAVCIVSIVLIYLLCRFVGVDYGFFGIMLPVLTSLFDEKYPRLAMFSLGLIMVCILEYGWYETELYSLISIPLLLLYNGKPGKVRMKYFFYIFYPLHLVIIYIISLFI